MKFESTLFLLIFLIAQIGQAQHSITATYTSGDIPTSYLNYNSTCTGPTTTLDVQLPSQAGSYEVVGIDIRYDFVAHSGGFIGDQQSQVFCSSTGTLESGIYSGTGTAGTHSYERLNIDIANGDYSPNETISFEMRAWRTFNAVNSDCSTAENFIDDGTWEITIHYIRCPFNAVIWLDSPAWMNWYADNYGYCTTIPEIAGWGDAVLVVSGSVTDLSALSNITTIEGGFSIGPSSDLADFTGLDGLVTVGGDLDISFNNNLQNLNGLGDLESIGGQFIIESNPALSDLSVLSDVYVQEVIVLDNDAMISLDWTIGIIDITNLVVSNNDALINLQGLSHLNSIDMLTIENNDQLNDISVIKNFLSIQDKLVLKNNSSLSECCFLDVLYPRVFGRYDFSGNGMGCETMASIRTTCELIDPDKDGIQNIDDNCPDDYNPNQEDDDGDNIGNPCDNCPLTSNNAQADADNNFIGDACESQSIQVAEVDAYELILRDTHRSIVLTNANGDCFKLYVDLEGKLQTKAVTCP